LLHIKQSFKIYTATCLQFVKNETYDILTVIGKLSYDKTRVSLLKLTAEAEAKFCN